ncbi:hypothetical protein M433DRAFT_4038, partial [Acidomyces richmondensis BFW]
MAPLAVRLDAEVIDLVSDSENASAGSGTPSFFSDAGVLLAPSPQSDTPDLAGTFPAPAIQHPAAKASSGQFVVVDGEDIFIPDEEFADVSLPHGSRVGRIPSFGIVVGDQDLTFDVCLQRVLEIFPDVSHDHVLKLYEDFDEGGDFGNLRGYARLDSIVEQLVSGPPYPKQDKVKATAKKRKREERMEDDDEDEDDDQLRVWERRDRAQIPPYLRTSMRSMLKVEFPEMTVVHINDTLDKEKYFYHAYITLAKERDDVNSVVGKLKGKARPRDTADAAVIASVWPPLLAELKASRKKVEMVKLQVAAELAKRQAELENVRRAIERGETAECQACFDELPMNRQVHCDGPVAHFTCFGCMTAYISSEVGESRCRVLCTAGCGAGFTLRQLNQLEDKALLDKLAAIEQEKAIRDAGLEDLEECPFCDYKAILPPIDEDFEFRCANPECEKVSCRRCKSVSHIPISCEQHAREHKANSRHLVEEAMTAALIRSCNKCKKQFIKEYGCNKMTCPSCGNLQCYVCSQSLKDYNHFDQNIAFSPSGSVPSTTKCPLYDNVEERHEREVQAAERKAREAIIAANPGLIKPEDLDIRISDAVRQATAERIRRAADGGDANAADLYFPVVHHHRLGHNAPRRERRRILQRLDGAHDEENGND